MRKKIYQLHRRLSIIIAIPVLLWAISGFMHPLMTNIRPAIATQGIPSIPIDTQRVRFPLAEALRKHHLDSFSNFRLVHIDTNWFYQVQPLAAGDGNNIAGIPVYISCTNGNILTAGDWLYAQYLARQFLEGAADVQPPPQIASPHATSPDNDSSSSRTGPSAPHVHTASLPNDAASLLTAAVSLHDEASSTHDCCGAATESVLNPVKGAKVANVSLVKAFDNEYKGINRLLPVYRVSFDRPDGIRIYVETTQDRFSFAMDNRRAIFDEIFRLCHTWGWLDFLGKGRLAVETLVALAALLTTVLGIYIFFTTHGARSNGNGLVKARRNHRYTAIVASLFTLLWTFSGSFHAFSKFTDDTRDRYFAAPHFAAGMANGDCVRLQSVCARPITNMSLVQMNGDNYWRVTLLPEKAAAHKDLMKDAKTAPPPVSYIRAADYSVLAEGDARYAAYLAGTFSQHPPADIRSVTAVTSFGDEYNFTDKRLPVWKVSYAGGHNERLYIETSTGKLASRVDDRSVVEGYSFSIFHKHHFMDAGGKTARDVSTMFWAFMQVVLVTMGLILWFRRRNARKERSLLS
ncbi:PepSY domain-containing protein [Flavitalea sp. BT771]|uniref:PepSY domain-containing protein n=1 Tax=Flavitalea sp. BT771 TaxID=3063329 RepID=UPI0026E28E65|nr:PepSY domain-containing protein [Flavitalea sp. BT771]MDO6435273.1 PepSY domain-containing protein [Flavitalea sp. BT771]MDV6224022.1 PepSY domain-containing protein [Flavitalea sp. BT771]